MEINERIDSCLSDIERKQKSVERFQLRVRSLIDGLKTEGMTPGTVSSLLQVLESVLTDYAEIGASCHTLIESLRAIGDHLKQVESGRGRIISGVETILGNLSHLDQLSQNGMQVGTATGAGAQNASNSTAPKRILLVRISPETEAQHDATAEEEGLDAVHAAPGDDSDESAPSAESPVVH